MSSAILANDEVYHVFNRGTDKRSTFTHYREYNRALLALDFYHYDCPPLRLAKVLQLDVLERIKLLQGLKKAGKRRVEIICFCLMPNHYHLLLKQKLDKGISRFMNDFSNSYTRYFNIKNNRVGVLFQGTFKAVRIEDDEQLLHVSRYIHLNPVVSCLVKEKDLDSYIWSSLPEYLGLLKEEKCVKELILELFKTKEEYRKFVYDQIDYAKQLEKVK